MTPRTRSISVIALIFCLVTPTWGQQYQLYTPQAATPDKKVSSQEGILVQEVEVQKGDTLYGLSHKFSGHGMYYPQILLFNTIKNPSLIHPGNTLKIPVAQNEAHGSAQSDLKSPVPHKTKTIADKQTALKTEVKPAAKQSTATVPSSVTSPSAELSLSDLKTVVSGKSKGGSIKKKTAGHVKKSQPHAVTAKSDNLSIDQAAQKNSVTVAPAPLATAGQKLFEAAVKAYRKDDCRTALELFDRYVADNSSSPLAADANLYKAECYLKLSAQ